MNIGKIATLSTTHEKKCFEVVLQVTSTDTVPMEVRESFLNVCPNRKL